MKNTKDIVSNICSHCNGSCFRSTCPRKEWNSNSSEYSIPQLGIDKECPLLQFEAEKITKKSPFMSQISRTDINKVCINCQYRFDYIDDEIDYFGDNMSLMMAHCYDCQAGQIKESLAEACAEASVS